jgi:hypothetical protein
LGRLGQKLVRGEEISNGYDRDTEQPEHPATAGMSKRWAVEGDATHSRYASGKQRRQEREAQQANAATSGSTVADAIYLSSKPFWKD